MPVKRVLLSSQKLSMEYLEPISTEGRTVEECKQLVYDSMLARIRKKNNGEVHNRNLQIEEIPSPVYPDIAQQRRFGVDRNGEETVPANGRQVDGHLPAMKVARGYILRDQVLWM